MLTTTPANLPDNFKCGCGCIRTATVIKKVPGNNNAPMQAVAVCFTCGSDAAVIMQLQEQKEILRDVAIALAPKDIFEKTKTVKDKDIRIKLMQDLRKKAK